MRHYYFEKYQCLDGEGEYNMQSVSQSEKPFEQKQDQWLREMIEFSVATNNQKPWSETRIKQWLASDDQFLDIYGGIRIYRHFILREISKAEYEVLQRFISW